MKTEKAISFQTKGTSRKSRDLVALDPKYFGIDERTLADLMKFTLDYSEYVQFENFNEEEAHWKTFFDSNLAFLTALIQTVSIESIDQGYREILIDIDNNLGEKKKEEKLRELILLTYEQFLKI